MRKFFRQKHSYSKGITSIFAVIFAATLLTIIVVSFATIMMREQERSTNDELSQSAYDSAMAGVEDAKRVIGLSQKNASVASHLYSNGDNCSVIASAATLGGITLGTPGQETLIQSTSGGASVGTEMLQAYTCVKIDLDSPDVVLNDVNQFQSRVVPLRGSGEFDTVRIQWHMTDGTDISSPCGALSGVSVDRLCLQSAWSQANVSRPGIVRAQIITPSAGFNLGSLDQRAAGNTVFLYPNAYGTVPAAPVLVNLGAADRARFVDENGEIGIYNQVQRVQCRQGAAATASYHCEADIRLPVSVPANVDRAILRLTTIYKTTPTNIRVTLYNKTPDNAVDFSKVQPIVDSTGRANDLFRRVQARVSLVSDVQYPEFAVDLASPFCKDFYLTPEASSAARVGGIPVCRP